MPRKKQEETIMKTDSLSTSIAKTVLDKFGQEHHNASLIHKYYENCNLLRRLVDYCPDRATKQTPLFFGKEEAEREQNEALMLTLNSLEFYGMDLFATYDWASFWAEAMKLADLEGNSYVILGSDDGNTELEITNVTWLATLPKESITRIPERLTYRLNKGQNQSEQVRELNSLEFHRSRVVRLHGIKRLSSYNINQYDISVLKPILDHYIELEQSYCNTREMVRQHSIFVLAKQGLASVRARIQETELTERLKGLMAGMSNLGGLLVDKEKEEATLQTRTYTGLDKIIQINNEFFVAHTGYPKSFIFGKQESTALSASGDSDDRKLAAIVHTYQHQKYKPAILHVVNLVAQNTGFGIIDNFDFDTTYQSSALEEVTIEKMHHENRILELQIEQMENPPEEVANPSRIASEGSEDEQ